MKGIICTSSFRGGDEGAEENQDPLLDDWGCRVSGISRGSELVGFGPASVTLVIGGRFGVLVVETGLGLFPSCA